MARFTSYPNKPKPTDADTLLINDAGSDENKTVLFSAVFSWIKDRFSTSTIDGFSTENKTVVGALNEVDANTKSISNTLGTKPSKDEAVLKTDMASTQEAKDYLGI